MDEATLEGGPAISTAVTPEQSSDKSPEELRRDIEKTRDQLGDTVEALAEKTDVKAQVKQRISSLKESARQKQEQAKQKVQAAAPRERERGGPAGRQHSGGKSASGRDGRRVRGGVPHWALDK